MSVHSASAPSKPAPHDVLSAVHLRPTPLRVLVLEMADEIAASELDAAGVLRRIYQRGKLVPQSSLYRVLNEFERLGMLRLASGRGWPRI